MSDGKSIREIHLGFVDLLKARGEEVVQPRGKPMCSTYGYDKTIGLISAGSIFYKKEDGTYELLQDMLTHAYTGVKLEMAELCINIGEGEGQAVVSPEGKIEFHDTGLNISLRDLQFVVQEAEAYIKYRKERMGQTQAN